MVEASMAALVFGAAALASGAVAGAGVPAGAVGWWGWGPGWGWGLAGFGSLGVAGSDAGTTLLPALPAFRIASGQGD
jgi:hypothetical protein